VSKTIGISATFSPQLASIQAAALSGRQRDLKIDPTRGACRAPGSIHAYQAVSEEINRSLGFVTPSLASPAQRKPAKLFSQKRTGLLNCPRIQFPQPLFG
jgi:hypothetical protein